MNILEQIITEKRKELEYTKNYKPLQHFFHQIKPSNRDFKSAISQKSPLPNLIAEIKKASPSEGIMRQKIYIKSIIRAYEKYAKALSIVTEKNFFLGSSRYLKKAAALTELPLLRKDFIIDEYQIYESRYLGADAILLIAKVLSTEEIINFRTIAKDLNMASIVEIQDADDLKKALHTQSEIIGINNRNLLNFTINLEATISLSQKIPQNCIIIAESGIKSQADILQLKDYSQAVLMGSVFMKSKHIPDTLHQIFGVK